MHMHVKSMKNLFMLSPTNVMSVRFMTESVHFTRRRDMTADVSLKDTILVKTCSTRLTRERFLLRVRMHICNIRAPYISNVVSQMFHMHDLLFISVRLYVDLSLHFPTLHHKCYDPSVVSHQCPYAKIDDIRIPALPTLATRALFLACISVGMDTSTIPTFHPCPTSTTRARFLVSVHICKSMCKSIISTFQHCTAGVTQLSTHVNRTLFIIDVVHSTVV